MITRQLYAGAGKVGCEGGYDKSFAGLQLSQRSDFVETVLSIETMTQRPIINTRDEPHADTQKYRRLHLILGDANMSPYATALKVGATRLVLALIDGEALPAALELDDPVTDVKRVSRDTTGKVMLKLKSGKTITPIEIQEWYLELAQKRSDLAQDREEWNWVTGEWERTLSDLKHQPEQLADRIDWAIKKSLFADFMESEGLDWKDPVLQSLDLEYHNMDPERGLFYGLQQNQAVLELVPEVEIQKAMHQPPAGTRARIRGGVVDREPDQVKKIHWTGIEFMNGDFLDLSDVITQDDVEQVLNSHKEQYAWK
jgi:proteasome accessory factor A